MGTFNNLDRPWCKGQKSSMALTVQIHQKTPAPEPGPAEVAPAAVALVSSKQLAAVVRQFDLVPSIEFTTVRVTRIVSRHQQTLRWVSGLVQAGPANAITSGQTINGPCVVTIFIIFGCTTSWTNSWTWTSLAGWTCLTGRTRIARWAWHAGRTR